MSRCYADPVQVLRRDGTPEQFLWSSRLYLVRAVLAEWVESAVWWRTPTATALHTGERTEEIGLPEGDRQLWRVQAGTGRGAPTGVFDLTYLEADDRWFLTRVHD
ncbi:MAG TPA: DUF6504 family protein [Mycobacteriales bacterium]|jgi:hypothetical protein|nr:DUF6504 family protein [Mycobacteriales bacterium]